MYTMFIKYYVFFSLKNLNFFWTLPDLPENDFPSDGSAGAAYRHWSRECRIKPQYSKNYCKHVNWIKSIKSINFCPIFEVEFYFYIPLRGWLYIYNLFAKGSVLTFNFPITQRGGRVWTAMGTFGLWAATSWRSNGEDVTESGNEIY